VAVEAASQMTTSQSQRPSFNMSEIAFFLCERRVLGIKLPLFALSRRSTSVAFLPGFELSWLMIAP
jgi:hypothetical protein